jgi:hypothetical protein
VERCTDARFEFSQSFFWAIERCVRREIRCTGSECTRHRRVFGGGRDPGVRDSVVDATRECSQAGKQRCGPPAGREVAPVRFEDRVRQGGRGLEAGRVADGELDPHPHLGACDAQGFLARSRQIPGVAQWVNGRGVSEHLHGNAQGFVRAGALRIGGGPAGRDRVEALALATRRQLNRPNRSWALAHPRACRRSQTPCAARGARAH